MLDTELSNIMSKGEGMGLKKALMSQLLNQASTSTPTKEIKGGRLEDIKPVLNNKAALKEFQSHIRVDEFISPVRGAISSGYGIRKEAVGGGHEMHSGIDIKAPEGTPVYPASAGLVVFSGNKPGDGNVVEIEHDNGYLTRYSNSSELRARKGDRVEPDDIIA
ncbi:MAG: peptidoglycan DD-metalloendopeptidase family protein, partial [Proteobacteria bacterium]|nr:peptidoglycan DD-metalloendopeptidase family protein [Pseudomonadota bacterium]